MIHVTTQSQEQEPSCTLHTEAFSGWLATKTRDNVARKGALQELRQVAKEAQTIGSHRATIVVVDDEAHIAVTLSEILERQRYRAVWFTDPLAALAFLGSVQPDLLLTDVNMPVLDGFGLALRAKCLHPDCPVLILSAEADGCGFEQRISAAGLCVAVEAKPLPICRLLDRVAALLFAKT